MQRIANQLSEHARTIVREVGEEIVDMLVTSGAGVEEFQTALNEANPEYQARLRRAVSTAYYAVFHAIIEASIDRFASKTSPEVQAALVRAFEHTTMKSFARSVASGSPPKVLQEVFTEAPSELKQLVDSLSYLQDERHAADYDLSEPFASSRAGRSVEAMIEALDVLDQHKISPLPMIDNFLMLLPVARQLRAR